MGRLRYIENSRTGSPGTLVELDTPLQFYNDDSYIYCASAGALSVIGGTSLALTATTITLTGAVTVNGDITFTGDDLIAVTVTNPTVATNAIYGLINAGSAWAGNLVGLRGKVVVTASGDGTSATGVWAGVQITSAGLQRHGLIVGLNVEAYSTTVNVPNAVAYLQSLPSGSAADFSDVPYLVFSETVSSSGTGSNILFEVGHSWANTVPTLTTGTLFYQDTLQIAVNLTAGNRTAYYIPLSTAQGTYTTAYPIATSSTVTSTSATPIILNGAITKGINFASATLAFNQENAYLAIGTWSVPKVITNQTAHFVPIQVNLTSSTSISADIAAARFRVNTGAANTLTAVNVLELRSQLANNVAQHTVVQASTTVSAAVEVQTGEALVAYFAFDGSGAMTNIGSNPNIAIAEFKVTNTGTTLSDMCIMEGTTGTTAVNMLRLQTAGTVTSMINFITASGATVENLFSIDDNAADLVSAYTTEEAPTGKIKISVNGATGYLAYWD